MRPRQIIRLLTTDPGKLSDEEFFLAIFLAGIGTLLALLVGVLGMLSVLFIFRLL